MKLVLPTYLASGGLKGDRPIRYILDMYKQNGIESAALNFTQKGDISFDSKDVQLESLKEHCMKQEIDLSSISTFLPYQLYESDKPNKSDKPDIVPEADNIILKMIYIASILSVPFVVIHGTQNRILKSMSYQEAVALETRAINLYSRLAAEKGVTLCIENSFCGLISTCDEFCSMFNENKATAFCYDTGNSYFVSAPQNWCGALCDKLEYVHLSNIRIRALRGMMVEFTDFNKGYLDMGQILDVLKNINYRGYVMVEEIEELNRSDEERISSIKNALQKNMNY